MCLIAEIAMFVMGIIGLTGRKIKLSNNLYVEGKRAQITGGILMIPLVLALCVGFAAGFMGFSTADFQVVAMVFEFLLILGALGGAFLYARTTQPSEPDDPFAPYDPPSQTIDHEGE